jgi:hypothetical protein
MLYPFYVSYTKIFTIFGLAQHLLHKIKHQSLLNKKEKEKENSAVGCLETGPQTGPLLPARVRAAHARALSLSLSH